MRLPLWLGPGALTISHVDCGEGGFNFVLVLRHSLFGEIIRQTVRFQECLSHDVEDNSDE
jgi:hypothetical protein